MPENTPVWIDNDKCKACSKCVSVCPAGVLAMDDDPSSTIGSIAKVIEPNSCIGCTECELSCPDFAIKVAEKSDYKFAKLTNESKLRAEQLKENNFKVLNT